MKVTVCELPDRPEDLEAEWDALVAHARVAESELVLLPEMPFYSWLPARRDVDPELWRASVAAHDRWMERLDDLAPAAVLGSRPVLRKGRRLNEAFLWDPRIGCEAIHAKLYLPDEPGFWEASWYDRGETGPGRAEWNGLRIGFLICTEIWFAEHARRYGADGVHILACPRATPRSSTGAWLAGGRTAAVVAGAYCLSSNRRALEGSGRARASAGRAEAKPEVGDTGSPARVDWGGTGWIMEPEAGELLGATSARQPFLTLDLDPSAAEAVKSTYPRYVEG